MKPLLLFTPIFSFTAEMFVDRLLEVESSEDQEFWINSPGGSVFAGHAILGALNERSGKNNAKVFGSADSMIAFMLLFMDNVEALDVSTFRLHRADGFIDSDQDQALLDKINKDLRAKMQKKIDPNVFKDVTGHSIAEMFDSKTRIDIDLDAKEAKKIGLINKIIRLEPTQIAAMSEKLVAFADFDSRGSDQNEVRGSTEKQVENKSEIKTIKKMTKEEFKAQSPEVYSQIFNDGVKAGIDKEKDRVEAFLEFVDIDAESVKAQISENKAMTSKFMAEMTKKNMAKSKKEDLTAEKTKDQNTSKKEETLKEVEAAAFEKELNEELNIKEAV